MKITLRDRSGKEATGIVGRIIGQGTMPVKGLGDVVHAVAKPIAKALGMDCIDKATGELKPESPCAKRRDALNKAIPFN